MATEVTFSVAQRVAHTDGSRATIRYIGPVATSKNAATIYIGASSGQLTGVEWDDPTRGKGDGAVVTAAGEEVRYFTCPPGCGSFVKPELLVPGRDLLAALHEKYMDDGSNDTGGAIATAGGRAIPVLLVGDDKVREQQRLEKLTHAALRMSLVNAVGAASGGLGGGVAALAAAVPRLRELDLSGNLLADWADVALLGGALPLLRVLNLAENRFTRGPLTLALADTLRGCLAQVKTLVVSDTGMSWSQVELLDALAPGVEEVHAGRNGIDALVPAPRAWDVATKRSIPSSSSSMTTTSGAPVVDALPATVFPRLRVLNLSDNALEDWGQVYALRHLQSLAWLLLNDNAITNIWCDAAAAAAAAGTTGGASTVDAGAASGVPFPRLEQLSLGGNRLGEWCAVDALDALPVLTTLRLQNGDVPPTQMPLMPGTGAAVAGVGVGGSATGGAGTDAAATAAGGGGGAPAALGPSEARQAIVARLPRLTSLNNSEVRHREREDAEKAYTRKAGAAFASTYTGPGVAELAAAAAVAGGSAAPASVAAAGRAITDIFGVQAVPPEAVAAYVTTGVAPALAASSAAASAAAVSPSDASAAGGGGGGGGGLVNPIAAALAAGVDLPSSTAAPAGFKKGADTGVIRAVKPLELSNPFVTSPHPLHFLSRSGAGLPAAPATAAAAYVPALDPFGLGARNPAAAGLLQSLVPRYFMLAALYDLHAGGLKDAIAATTIASSSINVTLRSMAGDSCMLEPVTRRLPLTMTIAMIKQLLHRLYKCEPHVQRLSFRESSGSYPALMDDDGKTLGYYAAGDAGEILMEAVDPAEAARQAAEAERVKEERIAEQAAAAELRRKAQEMSVAADRKAAVATAVLDM